MGITIIGFCKIVYRALPFVNIVTYLNGIIVLAQRPCNNAFFYCTLLGLAVQRLRKKSQVPKQFCWAKQAPAFIYL